MRRIRLPLNRPLALLLLLLLTAIIVLGIYYCQQIAVGWENLDILNKLKQVFRVIVNPIVILWLGSGLLALTISYFNSRPGFRITIKVLLLWLLFGLFGLFGILIYILFRGRSRNI